MTDDTDAAPLLRDADFVRSSADWTWETDAALRIVALSVHVAAITGRPALSYVGKPLAQLGRLADGPLTRDPPAGRPFRTQFITIGSGPVTYHYRLSGTPLLDADGKCVGYRGSARSVDAVVAAAPSTSFLTGVAREFRDPLNAIITLAERIGLTADGPLASRYADYARDIVGAGRHLLSFVDGALHSDDEAPLTSTTLVAGEVLRSAVAIVRLAAEAKRIAIDLPPADDILLAGDERGVCQILVNLLGNAVKFTPNGGRIFVRVDRLAANAKVEISVRDSGPGIAEGDQERIFRKFERAASSGDAPSPGSVGLGLHISRELAERMGGRILVESRPGQGARFALRLPAA